LSYDYIDQVLFPSLELLGVPPVERKCEFRGWSHGTRQIGSIKFKFTPLAPGQRLHISSWPSATSPGPITRIDITTIIPRDLHAAMRSSLDFELNLVFPGTETKVVVDEDSRHPARVYVLLVAHTSHGFRFGSDWLYDKTTRKKRPDAVATEVAQKVVDELDACIRRGGTVDEYLQDQVVVFQALAEGRSRISDCKEDSVSSEVQDRNGGLGGEEEGDVFDRTDEPFGNGSLHTRSAKWVVSQMLMNVKWLDKGAICVGVGWKSEGLNEVVNGVGDLSLDDIGK
jgi:RNA 3'-terminal phosphate cyclase (ATP)